MDKNTENTILKKLKNDLILKHSSNMLKFWLSPPGLDLTRLWSQSGYICFRCYLHQLKGIKNKYRSNSSLRKYTNQCYHKYKHSFSSWWNNFKISFSWGRLPRNIWWNYSLTFIKWLNVISARKVWKIVSFIW